MKKAKKNIKGFTLIELLVVMAMMSILMVMIFSILSPVGTVFNETSKYQQQTAITKNTLYLIEEDLRYADDVTILTNCNATFPTSSVEANKDYSIICINNEKITTVHGGVYRKTKLADTPVLLTTADKYSMKITFPGSISSSLMTNFYIFTIDKAGNETDKLTTKSTIILKNLALSSKAILNIDLVATPSATLTGWVLPAGKTDGNTYIIYHKVT